MPSWISHVCPNGLADVRTWLQRNHTRFVDHLVQNRHEVRSLYDFVRAAIDGWHHRAWQAPRDASVVETAIRRRVRRSATASAACVGPRRGPLLRLCRGRRDLSVWRIDDQPAAAVHGIQVLPEHLPVDWAILRD